MKETKHSIEDIQEQIDKYQKELDYDTRDYPINYLVELYSSDEEEMFAPDYQRNELLWKLKDKSRFIESLILDYPIPLIFLSDTEEGKLEIIDGLQRISTLNEFLKNDFKLKELKKLDKLNNLSFEDLPMSEKRRLKSKSLRIIVLKKTTPLETRKELFDRINTSSLIANKSEIRAGREKDNGLMKLINRLKDNNDFQTTTNLSKNLINRKEDIELISRFFAYSNKLDKYNSNVANFIDEFIKSEGENWSDSKEEKFENEFLKTINFVKTHFDRGFQKEGRNQTPRVRFEAISVGVNLALKENPDLYHTITKDKINELLNSSEFKSWTTTDAANNKNKVYSRINGVKNFLVNGTFNEED